MGGEMTVSLPGPYSCEILMPGSGLHGTKFESVSLTLERGRWLLEIKRRPEDGGSSLEGVATILGSGVAFTNRGQLAHRWEWRDGRWEQTG